MLFPVLFALGKIKLDENGKNFEKNSSFIFWIVFVILMNLALILSCTRGIWVSIIFPIGFLAFFAFKKIKPKNIFLTALLSLAMFVLIFPFANLLFAFPQFGLSNIVGSQNILIERLMTSASIEETSNLGRIFIWKETLKSIISSPLLGVGIGNFPIVLSQDISLARAGSSAHNLYLNIGAEMGIFAMVVFVFFLFEILKNGWQVFRVSGEFSEKVFAFCSVVFLIWVFGYSFTDAALFDERTFLLFMILCGMITGLKHNLLQKSKTI
jgi:O-antigen ligase